MKRLSTILAAGLIFSALTAGGAQAAFGLKDLSISSRDSVGSPAVQAGSHPYALTAELAVNTTTDPESGESIPDEELKDLRMAFPPGLLGRPQAVPRCSAAEFLVGQHGECPDASALGIADIEFGLGSGRETQRVPVYSLQPAPGTVAKLGFIVESRALVMTDVRLDPEHPNRAIATTSNATQILFFFGAKVTIWGVPADPAHDKERGSCIFTHGDCGVSIPVEPFLTLPTDCTAPLAFDLSADSWQHPGAWLDYSVAVTDGLIPPGPLAPTGCANLEFSPRIAAKATTASAAAPSGFDFDVEIDDEGITNPEEGAAAASTVKDAEVLLPEGMTINPSVAEGLDVCTPAQLARESADSVPGAGCPEASKLGTLRVISPLVDEAIEGSVFLAPQDDPATAAPGAENPFDSLIALHLVLKNPTLGALVKLALKVEPDPAGGRLTAKLQDAPPLPFSSFHFHFREGARAALITPPACGTHTTTAHFTPWARPASTFTTTSSFQIARGVGGGPCPPGGVPPFKPGFEAGSLNNEAGAFSPFQMRLTRQDGEQDMTKFSSVLPPGVLGSLAGLDRCPEGAVPAARAKSARAELASPSCPPGSEIGRTLAGAGVGEALTYVGGRIYLAGPYRGAPLSVIAITPALAGPFDAGTVAVRLGLDLNPRTAEVEVDGAASDPIPHILKGIVLKLRDLRVYVDRPNFTLNPTSCDESSVRATLFGSYLDVLDPADDVPVGLATRYQAANCLNLGFKPRLGFQLRGGTERGGFPALRATYRPRSGDGNLEGLVVRLPRSAFLEQGHIRTICTRVQFAADACPPASRYGYIKAFTPLLDEPLQGPVYLRSSNHNLPDLVFDLHGLVDVEVATRIDSVRGGIRARVESAPDAPLSKVILTMQGGKKGLIVNSRDLCSASARAGARLDAHNGKRRTLRPLMRAQCKGRGGKSR